MNKPYRPSYAKPATLQTAGECLFGGDRIVKHFIVIGFFLAAILLWACTDERKRLSKHKLFKNCAALSLFMCVATLIVWGLAAACFEIRLDFAAGKGRYWEIVTLVGAAEVIVTHSYETPPRIIKHYPQENPDWRGWYRAEYFHDSKTPQGVEFSSRWLDFEVNQPRVLRWFGFSQQVEPDRYACNCIEIPYWFLVLLFAILPVSWRLQRKLNS